jgi:hypothetical protein
MSCSCRVNACIHAPRSYNYILPPCGLSETNYINVGP